MNTFTPNRLYKKLSIGLRSEEHNKGSLFSLEVSSIALLYEAIFPSPKGYLCTLIESITLPIARYHPEKQRP